MSFLVLGDQSTGSFATLRGPRWHLSPAAQVLLEQVNVAIRQQISLLSQLDKARLPELTSHGNCLLQYWAERATSHPVSRPVLVATSQCVDLLQFWDTTRDEDPSNFYIVGSCTGLLPAAAAAAFPACKFDWIPLAVRIICIAFRIGITTASTGDLLTKDNGSYHSWSSVVQGRISQALLEEFHETENISFSQQAYTSAITPKSTTISGPSQTLRKLFNSPLFRATGYSVTSIPVYSPYHAAHLYSEVTVDWILGANDPSAFQILNEFRPRLPLLSTHNGKPFLAVDMRSLLGQVVHEILNDVFRWDTLLGQIAALVPAKIPVKIISIGSSPLGESLAASLRSNQHEVSVTEVEAMPEKSVPMIHGPKRHKIAIVGISGRFPEAKNTDELWDLLFQGLDVHKHIPPDRFDTATHVDPSGKEKNTTFTPYGCFITQPGLFDPSFFQMSPREAKSTDPMQRLALVCAYEALESSGYVPNRTPSSMEDRAGVFLGQTIDDYREVNSSQDIDPFFVTGGLRPFGPGRINYYYKFTGPSYVVDTACSSSLAAIHIACAALQGQECDMAVAGGTNVISGSDMYAGLSRGQFLSKTGSCKTFDNDADGYCRADAVGTLVLKRLEDAEADHDPILGVIVASATNHSSNATSITRPHGPTQEALFRTVLDQAAVLPSEVDYIEMHGTGTQVGDGTEMRAVSNVFGGRARTQPLYVGSVKANLGHGEAAAGVTAVIKGLLMFRNDAIPAHVGIKGELNSTFPALEERQICIPRECIFFSEREGRGRRILVNNFGAAGGNTTLLLEEPPAKSYSQARTDLCAYPIAVSAKSSTSLKANIERLSTFLRQNDEVSLADLSYTTTSRRQHYRHRFVTITPSIQDLQKTLLTAKDSYSAEISQLVFVFTGQGAIYTGVARGVFQVSRQFHSDIIQFDHFAQGHGLPSFLPLLDETVSLSSLSTVQTQVGQVCIQMALYRLYQSWGVTPHAVVGHSLGEYAALYASGVLTASDTILIVGRRAKLMEQHCVVGSHAMLAVRELPQTVEELVGSFEVEVACINGPTDVVLSGSVAAIQDAATALKSRGVKSIKLPLAYACHSAQFDPLVEPFEQVARGLEFYPPKIPLLSPLIGRDISQDGVVNAKYLARHLREKVDFVAALENTSLAATGKDIQFIELGPHPICTGMIRNILGGNTIPSLRHGSNSWSSVASSLAGLYLGGLNIDWEAYNRDSAASVSCLPTLPSYAFDEKNYWIDYKNDWALSKGSHVVPKKLIGDIKPSGPATASVQRLLRESLKEEPLTAEFESDLAHPALYEAIAGHVVKGVALCPSAVFADMAFTVAKYLYEKTVPGFSELDMDIVNMEIISPVVLEVSGHQKPRALRISATINQKGACHVEWSDGDTADMDGPYTVYAKCTVALHEALKARKRWLRNKHFVCSRIDHLKSASGVNRLNLHMAYKLFASIVDYSKSYQGMDEVLLDGENYEAAAQVSFKTDNSIGNFFRSPYWVDNIAQLSGFVLNGNDMVDSSKVGYISNGWESMHLTSPLSKEQTYTVYVKMDPSQASAVSGDVYILDQEENIICVAEGIKFQAVPRPLLKLLLAPSKQPAVHHPDIPASSLSTPSSKSSIQSEASSATPISSNSSTQSSPKQPDRPSDNQQPKLSQTVLRVVCEETGLEVENLDKKLTFAEMGVDSMMSLTVSGRLRESFDLDLPSTIFQKHPTVELLSQFLDGGKKNATHNKTSTTQVPAPTKLPVIATPKHRATSVLLQGNLRTAAGNLFLFPGGFGTSSSFAPMPSIHSNLAIFGLNSAFVNAPENFTVSIPEMASLYLEEVRRRQPHGPYSFLGYSVGGIIGYEAARQLIVSGEAVERLYLVDSPCPLVIPPMPPKLIEYLDSIDRFSGKEQKEEVGTEEAPKPMGSLHVTQTLISLESYVPAAIPEDASSPKTTYYVAKQGVSPQSASKRPKVDENSQKVLTWLLDDRVGLGGIGDGWEKLVDGDTLKIVPIEGNHFNIMKEPHILEWTSELRRTYWK